MYSIDACQMGERGGAIYQCASDFRDSTGLQYYVNCVTYLVELSDDYLRCPRAHWYP